MEIPELAAGLEGFEVWDRRTHAPEHQEVKVAFVSLRVGGAIGMNTAAWKMWGEPEACQVMFDPGRRRIALKAVEVGEPNSYQVYGSCVQVPAKRFFDYYGVPTDQHRRYYDPKVVDGVLVVDL